MSWIFIIFETVLKVVFNCYCEQIELTSKGEEESEIVLVSAAKEVRS